MTVEVRYYAVLREKTGVAADFVEVPPGSDGKSLLAAVVRKHPVLQPYVSTLRLASETAYISTASEVSENAVILLIPPVSGG